MCVGRLVSSSCMHVTFSALYVENEEQVRSGHVVCSMNTSTGGQGTHAHTHRWSRLLTQFLSSVQWGSGHRVVVTVWRRKACPWSALPALMPPRPPSESWTCSTQPARTDRQTGRHVDCRDTLQPCVMAAGYCRTTGS